MSFAHLLVTGGAGFIGANFVRWWLAHRPASRITVLDALTYAGCRASLPEESERFRFVQGDICSPEAVAEASRGVDAIVHFAAESHVDRSIAGPAPFLTTNIFGTYHLLQHARREGLRFHHVSTDEVYGSLEPGAPAFREDSPYAPNSPYAASKAASDHLVRAWVRTYGLPATISNCSNNYGPFQFPEKLIPLCLVKALHGEPMPIYGDGQNVRDWLHVHDHCQAVALVLERGRPGETYNFGGGNEWANLELVHLLSRVIDEAFDADAALARRFPQAPPAQGRPTASLITFVPDRPGHDRRYAVDFSKARRELGFEPRMDFEQGLRETVRWYLEHEEWWRPLLARFSTRGRQQRAASAGGESGGDA